MLFWPSWPSSSSPRVLSLCNFLHPRDCCRGRVTIISCLHFCTLKLVSELWLFTALFWKGKSTRVSCHVPPKARQWLCRPQSETLALAGRPLRGLHLPASEGSSAPSSSTVLQPFCPGKTPGWFSLRAFVLTVRPAWNTLPRSLLWAWLLLVICVSLAQCGFPDQPDHSSLFLLCHYFHFH